MRDRPAVRLAMVGAMLGALACGGGGGDSGPPPPAVTATPSFSPPDGTYTTARSVAIATATPSATIHYTTDGSTPTSGSTVYVGPVNVTTSTTLRAIAVRTGWTDSAVASATYDIDASATPAATPTFTPAGGYYTSAQSVTISTTTPGATIRYTTDGSTPTWSSAVHGAPVGVSTSRTLRAFATVPGYAQSEVGTASYVFSIPGVSGTLDPAFAASGVLTVNLDAYNDWGNAVVIQPDGKIVVAGPTVGVGNFFDFALLRFHADGSRDTSFGVGGVMVTAVSLASDVANAMALQADGKIVVAGYSGTVAALARYDTDGFLDPTFGTSGTVQAALGATRSTVSSLAILDDGNILVGGWVDHGLGGSNDFMAARFTPDGSLDATFGTSGVATVPVGTQQDEAYALAVQPDGGIVLAGWTLKPGTTWDMAIARLDANGTLDPSFGTSGTVKTDFAGRNDCARAVAVLPGGEILVAGSAAVSAPSLQTDNFALARYTSSGALDGAFGTGGKVTTDFNSPTAFTGDDGYAMAVQGDGKIVVVGQVWDLDVGVARYLPGGALDPDFGTYGLVRHDFALPDDRDAGYAVALQPDGKIVVVGAADTLWNYTGQADWSILRYLP